MAPVDDAIGVKRVATGKSVHVLDGTFVGTYDTSDRLHAKPRNPPCAPFLSVDQLKARYGWSDSVHNQIVLSHMAEQLRLTLEFQKAVLGRGHLARPKFSRRKKCTG